MLKNKFIFVAVCTALCVCVFITVNAVMSHQGRLDNKGGHTDTETGEYHIHLFDVHDDCDKTLFDPPIDLKIFSAYKVLRVVDGDTVDILYDGKKERVRLVGVGAPEVHTKKEFYGEDAWIFLENLILGECVYFVPDSIGAERDVYGRLLGYLYRYPDGLFVNAELIRQGYARAYRRFRFEHSIYFVKLQQHARAADKGLWRR